MRDFVKFGFILLVGASLSGVVACGGSANAPKDPTAEEGEPKKELKKFEGNRMEKADEEE